MSSGLEEALRVAAASRERSIGELRALVRIPSLTIWRAFSSAGAATAPCAPAHSRATCGTS